MLLFQILLPSFILCSCDHMSSNIILCSISYDCIYISLYCSSKEK